MYILLQCQERRQKEKGAAEDEMIRQHHRFIGHEFEQITGDSGGEKRLVGYRPWGDRVRLSDWTTIEICYLLKINWGCSKRDTQGGDEVFWRTLNSRDESRITAQCVPKHLCSFSSSHGPALFPFLSYCCAFFMPLWLCICSGTTLINVCYSVKSGKTTQKSQLFYIM